MQWAWMLPESTCSLLSQCCQACGRLRDLWGQQSILPRHSIWWRLWEPRSKLHLRNLVIEISFLDLWKTPPSKLNNETHPPLRIHSQRFAQAVRVTGASSWEEHRAAEGQASMVAFQWLTTAAIMHVHAPVRRCCATALNNKDWTRAGTRRQLPRDRNRHPAMLCRSEQQQDLPLCLLLCNLAHFLTAVEAACKTAARLKKGRP